MDFLSAVGRGQFAKFAMVSQAGGWGAAGNFSKKISLDYASSLKGQCHEIYEFRFSTCISFPQAPDYTINQGRFEFFSKIHGDIRSSRCTTDVVDTGGKWEKSLIRKVFIISFGQWTFLGSRVSI